MKAYARNLQHTMPSDKNECKGNNKNLFISSKNFANIKNLSELCDIINYLPSINMNIKSVIRSKIITLFFHLKQKTYNSRLKYIFENNHSDTIVIVFPGFPLGEKPLYNYYRILKKVPCDKLFLLDDFGYRGSYFLFENGKKLEELVLGLLQNKINKRHKRIITAGSSKGGTCAIYYGLKICANDIYAGACQYYIGSYLNTDAHRRIFQGMMGITAGVEQENILDAVMPDCLAESSGKHSHIHLLYSTNENTYDEHIIPLIRDLNKHHLHHSDIILDFSDHAEVGIYFGPFIKDELCNLK